MLEPAIQSLYRTFRGYRPKQMLGCPCCTSEREGSRLLTLELHLLSADDLHHYAFKAMSTWGTVDDFKHFLPRILELVAREDGQLRDWVDIEILLGKLEYGHWHTWPQPERQAVQDYLDALWSDLLGTYPFRHEQSVDSYLSGIGQCAHDLTPNLQQWQQDESLSAALHLADLIADNCPFRYKKPAALTNPWWDSRPEQAQQVWQWLLDDARVAQIQNAFWQCADEARQNQLARAETELAILRGWAKPE